MPIKSFLTCLLFLLMHSLPARGFEVTYLVAGEDAAQNSNAIYEMEVLRLSLEKTRAKYGPYQLNIIERTVGQKRALEYMSKNALPNYTRTLGFSEDVGRDYHLDYVRFPVYLGLLGYRTCFSAAAIESKVAGIKTVEDLLAFNQGVGIGWTDGTILKHAGFKTVEIQDYANPFEMTAYNRIDLYCRGASEVMSEYQKNIDRKGLSYNRSMAIYYPMPLFFYTHKSNTVLIARLREGLLSAHEDNSLQTLWENHFKHNIDFIKLPQRTIFRFDNPLLTKIDFDYQQYTYQPPAVADTPQCAVPYAYDDRQQRCVLAIPNPQPKPSVIAGKNELIIFYKRDDNHYSGWRLHLWNSDHCQSYPQAQLVGFSWEDGLAPEGEDALYGAYWRLKLKPDVVAGDCAKFLIHQGETKAVSPLDQSAIIDEDRIVFASERYGEVFPTYWVIDNREESIAD